MNMIRPISNALRGRKKIADFEIDLSDAYAILRKL